MLRKLLNNKKAQNTAEYAILISLVVAGIVAMQTYAQRALQARIRDASQYLVRQTSNLGLTNQYEPYYLIRSYNVERADQEKRILGQGPDASAMDIDRKEELSNRLRRAGGKEVSNYSTSRFGSNE